MIKRMIVGITGASGSVYAYKLVKTLVSLGWEVNVVSTAVGEKVLEYECGIVLSDFPKEVQIHANDNLFSPLASGSFRTSGMIVMPCSMNTLGHLAAGTGEHLLARAAQVVLKERRNLVVVPREMPYSIIHLENMLRLAKAGAIVMPASPGFYHMPDTIDDLVGHVVGRVLEQFGIEHKLYKTWDGGKGNIEK